MFENTPSDRVQVIGIGSLKHPGACALCGSGNCEDGYVSTSIYYEYEGFVYFCMTCAKQIAEVIGCLLPDESTHLREVAEAVARKCQKLEEKNADLNDRLSAWNTLIANSALGGATGSPVSESEPDGNVSNSDSPESATNGEPVPTQSVTKRRSNDASQSPVRNGKLNI